MIRVSWICEVVVVKPPGMVNAGVKVGDEQWSWGVWRFWVVNAGQRWFKLKGWVWTGLMVGLRG